MSHYRSIELSVLELLPVNMDNLVVLDVGVGEGFWGFFFRTRKLGKPYLIGVEPYNKYIENISKLPIYNELHELKAQQYLEKNPDLRVDVILLLEVMEHDTRENSFLLLKSLEDRLNKGGIIIVSTPNGFSEGAKEYGGNTYDKHLCGFEESDFKSLGYSVKSIRKDTNFGAVADFIISLWFMFRRGRKPVTHTIVAWRRF